MDGTKEQRFAFSCGHRVTKVFTKVGFFVVKEQTYHMGKLIEDSTVMANGFFDKLRLTMSFNNHKDSTFFWVTKDPEQDEVVHSDVLHLVLNDGSMKLINSANRDMWPKDAIEHKNFADAALTAARIRKQR